MRAVALDFDGVIADSALETFLLAPLGARCVLAAWGYNGERERIAAEAAGSIVCGAPELEARVLGGPLL